MLAKIKKIIFPFYRDRHQYLMAKPWFRGIFVIYMIGIVVIPTVIFFIQVDEYSDWCWNSLHLYYDTPDLYKEELENCAEIQREGLHTNLIVVPILTVITHYLIQLVFFKIIIDFITRGWENEQKNSLAQSKPSKSFVKEIKKYSIPLAIILGTGFLALAIYSVQVDKRKSIEEQQKADNERAELKLKQEECEALKAGLMKKWNNVVGVKYDKNLDGALTSGCVVVYIDNKTGGIEEGQLEYMETTK